MILGDIQVSGCFFHLSQAVYRHIASNHLASRYRTDPDFAILCRHLPALAFLPTKDVVAAFESTCRQIRKIIGNDLDKILEYFERTYIGSIKVGERA